jgi:Domain of unknown function DUF29
MTWRAPSSERCASACVRSSSICSSSSTRRAQEPRAGWRASIRAQRVRLRDALTPSLRREIESELAELYRDARGLAEGALRDHDEDGAADALPAACPYSLEQITGDWLPR